MKIRMLLLLTAGCFVLLTGQKLVAQDTLNATASKNDKKESKSLKNSIFFNLTNPMIFGNRAIIFTYERVVASHQSFSIGVGLTDLPSLNIVNSDSLKVKGSKATGGVHLAADYRFYLGKENKYNAPRGIYVGPYLGYNSYLKQHTWELQSVMGGGPINIESKTSLKIFTVGAELGYQFVFWDRLAVDLVLVGPGIASYSLKASLGSNLSDADKEKFFEKLNGALSEKFPGYSWTLHGSDFERKGSTNTTSWGYRYFIQVGFRF